MHRLTAALSGIAVAVVTGCGIAGTPAAQPVSGGRASASPASASAPVPGPPSTTMPTSACALLPKAEAEALAGTPLLDGVEANPASPQCLYAGPVDGPLAQVEVFVGDGAKKFLDIDRELAHEFTEVPGIGDEAHAEDNAIFARVRGTWFAVRLVRLNEPADNAPALVTAAKAVAARL